MLRDLGQRIAVQPGGIFVRSDGGLSTKAVEVMQSIIDDRACHSLASWTAHRSDDVIYGHRPVGTGGQG